jgi:hypothetical protein
MKRKLVFIVSLCLLPYAMATGAGEPVTPADLSRTGDLICDMHVSSRPPRRGAPRADLMLIFDEVNNKPGTARVISSDRAGGRGVRIYSGETGVHLVEDISGSVVVTTLLGCELRSGEGRCLRYAAALTWHFDTSVHWNPDLAFRRLPGTSFSGTCEAWKMDVGSRAEHIGSICTTDSLIAVSAPCCAVYVSLQRDYVSSQPTASSAANRSCDGCFRWE